jgi:hypothetical protein
LAKLEGLLADQTSSDSISSLDATIVCVPKTTAAEEKRDDVSEWFRAADCLLPVAHDDVLAAALHKSPVLGRVHAARLHFVEVAEVLREDLHGEHFYVFLCHLWLMDHPSHADPRYKVNCCFAWVAFHCP